jgi:hypothetical protein
MKMNKGGARDEMKAGWDCIRPIMLKLYRNAEAKAEQFSILPNKMPSP